MSSEPLKGVYLFTGTDRPKVRRALARLRARFDAGSLEQLDAGEASGADAVAACNALGLFGAAGERLVVVEGVERWKADDVAAVTAYLDDPAPGSVLALVAEENLKSQALAQACARAGQVLEYDAPKPRDLPAWVRAQFERLHTAIDTDGARALVEIVGEDVTALSAEVEKIATWARGKSVGRREVERLAVPAREASAWAVTDAWGARDAAALLTACEAELEQGVEPFWIASRVAAQIELVRAAQLLAEEGLGAREIAKRLRKHEFRVRKALAHAENYSHEELDDAIVRLAALDAALKGASTLSPQLELERTLAEVTARREQPLRA